MRSRAIAGRPHEVLPWLLEVPGPVRAVSAARHRIGKFLWRREIYFTGRGRGGGRA